MAARLLLEDGTGILLLEDGTGGYLLSGLVSADSVEAFDIGVVSVDSQEPFGVLGATTQVDSVEAFGLMGQATVDSLEPFDVQGVITADSVEPFDVLDGTVPVIGPSPGGSVTALANPRAGLWL